MKANDKWFTRSKQWFHRTLLKSKTFKLNIESICDAAVERWASFYLNNFDCECDYYDTVQCKMECARLREQILSEYDNVFTVNKATNARYLKPLLLLLVECWEYLQMFKTLSIPYEVGIVTNIRRKIMLFSLIPQNEEKTTRFTLFERSTLKNLNALP